MSASAFLGACATVALCAGCGWHAGLIERDDARTVGVEIFETRRGLLERNLEPIVSDALTRALSDFVDLDLAAPGRADLVVRGRIEDYLRREGIRTTENRLVETGVYVLITAEVFDRRTGKRVVPAAQRHVWSGYALGQETAENEALARERAIRHVAEALVLDLFGPRAKVASPDDASLDAPPGAPPGANGATARE